MQKKGKIITSKLLREIDCQFKIMYSTKLYFQKWENKDIFSETKTQRVCHQQIFTIGTFKKCALVRKKTIAKRKSEMPPPKKVNKLVKMWMILKWNYMYE